MGVETFRGTWFDGRKIPLVYVLAVCDREKDITTEPALFWLIVERKQDQMVEHSGAILDASISLSFEVVNRKHANNIVSSGSTGSFSGKYSAGYSEGGTVSLTGGALFLDPKELCGYRIGTYLMNEIVAWAQKWPAAEIKTIELNKGQAGIDNKERRNKFYRRFGIEFDFGDSEYESGRSKPMRVLDLKNVNSWTKNISILSMQDYIKGIHWINEKDKLDLNMSELARQSIREELNQAKATPIRWAWNQLLNKYIPIIKVVILYALFLFVVLFAYRTVYREIFLS